MEYKMTIGLETHIELLTNTKIFCSCLTTYGGEPNTQCCPVCLGLPGTLPTLNKKVVEFAVMAGLALNCKINNYSGMYRKNYVYPDLPKAFQITQGPVPICENGYVKIGEKTIRIKRIHIEEDAGKLIYENDSILADYNRAGVPLLEIVTEADFENESQVRDYLEYIRTIARYLEISDCKMQEGSLRCDVNISLKNADCDERGEKCEIKNINSINNICKAIKSEFARQKSILESGEKITSATLKYDEKTNSTTVMRRKETNSDYRYFPEPDLPLIKISREEIETIRETMPELPTARFNRYVETFGVSENAIKSFATIKRAGDFFEALVVLTSDPMMALDVINSCIFRFFETEDEKYDFVLPVQSEEIAEVMNYCISGKLPRQHLKKVILKMLETGKKFSDLYSLQDFEMFDIESTKALAEKTLKDNPLVVEDYKNGKKKAMSSLIGYAMRESNGKADIKVLTEFLEDACLNKQH